MRKRDEPIISAQWLVEVNKCQQKMNKRPTKRIDESTCQGKYSRELCEEGRMKKKERKKYTQQQHHHICGTRHNHISRKNRTKTNSWNELQLKVLMKKGRNKKKEAHRCCVEKQMNGWTSEKWIIYICFSYLIGFSLVA